MIGSLWLVRAAWIFTIGFTLVLLWALLTPVAQLPKVPDLSDYVWHIGTFATLVLPLCTIMPKQGAKIAVMAVLLGTLIEFIQPYFDRGFEIHDLGSNAIGIGLGWLISRPISVFLFSR